jgi:selenocysteine lyase/cysteine desulfurase
VAHSRPGKRTLRTKLADLAGCSPEELAIDRNATEAIDTVIFGLQLKAGDDSDSYQAGLS